MLLFAYHFPPENASGAARPFRFCKYLRRLGYRCHVITAANVSQGSEDDAEHIPDPFAVSPRTGAGWQLERLVRRFLLPGVVGTQWAIEAYRAGVRFARNERIAHNEKGAHIVVVSTAPPLGTLLAGYALSRRLKLPWIADFRDPLANRPAEEHLSRLSGSIYRKLEKIFASSPDCVIANTDAARDQLIKRYPAQASHFELIWNGFDPEQRLCPSSGP